MLLPVRKLNHFESFQVENMVDKKDKDYNNWKADDITVQYSKVQNWFIFKRLHTWKETYSFRRTSQPSEKEGYNTYTASNGFVQLNSQLQFLTDNDIKYISSEDYRFYEEKYPERFV